MTMAYDTSNRNRKIKRVTFWLKATLFSIQQQAMRTHDVQAGLQLSALRTVPRHQMKGSNQMSRSTELHGINWDLQKDWTLWHIQLYHIQESEHTFLSHPSSNLVTILTELSRIQSSFWDLGIWKTRLRDFNDIILQNVQQNQNVICIRYELHGPLVLSTSFNSSNKSCVLMQGETGYLATTRPWA